MLAPVWSHVRRGPLARGGVRHRDFMRKILLWNNFRPAHGEITGLRKAWLKRLPMVSEDQALVEREGSQADQLIVFAGEGKRFSDIMGNEHLLYQALREVTRPKWLQVAEQYQVVPIAINVRRGKDFKDARSISDFENEAALRTPIEWYVFALNRLRAHLGRETKAFVVSDGTPADLAPLLSLNNVELVNSRSAISDLLILAKAQILLASGGSSFSAWAAFLSKAPTFLHSRHSFDWFAFSEESRKRIMHLDDTTTLAEGLFDHVQLEK